MGNSNKKIQRKYYFNDQQNVFNDPLKQMDGCLDYFKLFLQETKTYNNEWNYITNKFENLFEPKYQRSSRSKNVINQSFINILNNNYDPIDDLSSKFKSNSNFDDESFDDDEDYLEDYEEYEDGLDYGDEDEETPKMTNQQDQPKPKQQQKQQPVQEMFETIDDGGEEAEMQLQLDRQEIIYDAKVAYEYPLGMHVIDNNFHYHFYVPDCKQSRLDFIEVNHIPVADLQNNNDLANYLNELGFSNSSQDPQLYRIPAKDTNSHRKIISLKCKFDIDIRISDCFWSNKGLKVRAYKLIGPTWTSVFSAYCFFERTSGINAVISTDMRADHFIDKVVQSNRFYCPDFRNIDNYCMDFPTYYSSPSKHSEFD